MTSQPHFDTEAAARRRLAEPEWRRFPSLWYTFRADKIGFLDSLVQLQTSDRNAASSAAACSALEQFFRTQRPHLLYPYVWVRNALNPVPDSRGMHQWVHEVLVSYQKSHMPEDAPVRFELGQLVSEVPPRLEYGVTSRFGSGSRDLVLAHRAYVHIGPAQRAAETQKVDEDMAADPPRP